MAAASIALDPRGRRIVADASARHLREVLRIDAARLPAARGRSACSASELAMTDTPRLPRRHASATTVVGHAGHDARRRATATSRRSPSTRRGRAAASAPGSCSRCIAQAVERGITALTLEVRVSQRSGPCDLPALRLRAGRRYAATTTPKNGEDAMVMWAHDVHQPAHAARLAGIEARSPRARPHERRPGRAIG